MQLLLMGLGQQWHYESSDGKGNLGVCTRADYIMYSAKEGQSKSKEDEWSCAHSREKKKKKIGEKEKEKIQIVKHS